MSSPLCASFLSLLKPSAFLLSAHSHRLQSQGSPSTAVAPVPQTPVPAVLTSISRYSGEDSAAVALRTVAMPLFAAEWVETVAEDTEKAMVLVRIHPPTRLSDSLFFSISRPKFEVQGEIVRIHVSLRDIHVFPDSDILPAVYSLPYLLETSKQLLESGKGKTALGVCLRGWKRFGENREMVLQCALCYRSLGNYERVAEMAGKLTEYASPELPGQVALADSLLSLNILDQAAGLLSRLSAAYPAHPQLQSALQRLSVLRHNATAYCSPTRLTRLRELVLVEWPSFSGWEDLKSLLADIGIPAERVSINGRIAILCYPTIEKRELARCRIEAGKEFTLANAPAG